MSKRLFVGNLSPHTTREDLEGLFSRFGDLAEIGIPTDRQTRGSRGFAFVEYVEPEDAENALEALDGARLAGRALRLSWARERDERPGTRQSGTARGSTSRDAGDGQDEESGPDRDEARSERDSRDEDDDYAGKRRTKPRTRRHGGHGSDRKRGRGTRRFLD